MNTKNLVVVGVGGHAVAAWDIAQQSNIQIEGFIDPLNGKSKVAQSILDSGIPISTFDFLHLFLDKPFFIAVGDNLKRYEILQFLQNLGIRDFPNLLSESARTSFTAQIGRGNFIGNNSSVGPHSRIADFVILNTGASVDHECEVDDFASLGPASILGGNVSVGEFTFIGMNTAVRQNVKVGVNCLIGASSYVKDDVTDNLTVWGIPAKIQKVRSLGDSFLI